MEFPPKIEVEIIAIPKKSKYTKYPLKIFKDSKILKSYFINTKISQTIKYTSKQQNGPN